MRNNTLISVVVPAYNEEESIPLFFESVSEIAGKMAASVPDGTGEMEFEYIFVDDGSEDATLRVLREISNENTHVRYISFSRNFGKEAALLAGLEASAGDYVAVMDADLQDPPELLPEMYAAITQDGYDCAAACRTLRKGEPVIRSFFARRFYKLINRISDTKMVDGARDFRLMTRQMVDAVLSMKEYNRFSKGLFNWVGFSTKWIEYENVPGIAGNTKWSFWQLFVYSIDGIIGFSVKPLSIAVFFGMFFCLFAFAGIVIIVIRYLLYGDPVAGWASTVTIVLFVGGIQLFCTGILGEYLAKSYMEGKRRPVYIVKEKSNLTEDVSK